MVSITFGISDEHLEEVFNDPSMNKLKHDFFDLKPIVSSKSFYYSAWVENSFVGAYLIIYNGLLELEAHMLLLPKAVKYQKQLSKLMAKELFNYTDRIYTIILEDMKSAINHVKKIGFKTEGIKREAFIRDGVKMNGVMFSLLKSEFKE